MSLTGVALRLAHVVCNENSLVSHQRRRLSNERRKTFTRLLPSSCVSLSIGFLSIQPAGASASSATNGIPLTFFICLRASHRIASHRIANSPTSQLECDAARLTSRRTFSSEYTFILARLSDKTILTANAKFREHWWEAIDYVLYNPTLESPLAFFRYCHSFFYSIRIIMIIWLFLRLSHICTIVSTSGMSKHSRRARKV